MLILSKRRKLSELMMQATVTVDAGHNGNNRPVKRLIGGQVATGLLYWTACRLELWDSDAVFITQNWEVG